MGTSYQKGWVMLRGKKWYGYFRRTVIDPKTNEPKPAITPIILGLKAEMSKSQARAKLEVEIGKLGKQSANGDRSIVSGTVTLRWFVENRFIPLKEPDWREETAKIKKHLIETDVLSELGEFRLENFDKFVLQTHLNKLAKIRSRDRVLQMRSYIKSVFSEAVDQDFLAKDPARKLKTPANLRESDKTVLTWDQLAAALARMELRDRILMKLDMTNALRPSELFAFRWRCHRSATLSLTIVETIYKGKIRPFGKTKGSLKEIPIPQDLSDELLVWREVCQEGYDKRKPSRGKNKDRYGLPPSDPEAFIFPGRFGSFMDPSNYRKRVLHKLAEDLGLPKLNFQVIRRTIATLAQRKGTVKDVQGVMRHTRVATTTDIYMQEIAEGVRATVDSIHDELDGTMKRLTGKVGPQTATTASALVN